MNKPLARSPDRHSFQRNNYIKRVLEQGKSLDDPNVRSVIEYYESWTAQDLDFEQDTDRHENNLEYDLRTCDWIIAKVRANDAYAQNLYAAMCNRQWLKLEVLPILRDDFWSCTWRYAGGIVADMRGEGDYIDWYCSGSGGLAQDVEEEETQEQWQKRTGYVPESVVTEEIEKDLAQLGWQPVTEDQDA